MKQNHRRKQNDEVGRVLSDYNPRNGDVKVSVGSMGISETEGIPLLQRPKDVRFSF